MQCSEQKMKAILSSRLFKGFDANEATELFGCLNPSFETYDKNEIIAIEGDPLFRFGLVISGIVSVIKEKSNGSRVIMSLLNPGDLFGEMVAFSNYKSWPASVQAVEPSEVMFIEVSGIVSQCSKVCNNHSRIIDNMLSIISNKALMLNKKLEYLSIKSMRGRLSAYLIDQSKLFSTKTFAIPMNRNELADFLNVSRPSMSREMARMKEEGLIDYHLNTVKIIDITKLENYNENA